MSTITLKINDKSKAGRLVTEFLDIMKKQPGVKIVEETDNYNPEFVNKVLKSKSQKGGKTVTADNLWQSIK